MNFDTTARQRVAPGAEKQDMPACLPLVSSSGDERAAMNYETKSGVTIKFRHESAQEQPILVLCDVPGIPGCHTYKAAAFLDAASLNRGFVVGVDWSDQTPFHIEAPEVLEIAQWVHANTDRRCGYFETTWIAQQPSEPF